MKKLVSIMLLFALLFSFAACKKEDEIPKRPTININKLGNMEMPFYDDENFVIKFIRRIDKGAFSTQDNQLEFVVDSNYKETVQLYLEEVQVNGVYIAYSFVPQSNSLIENKILPEKKGVHCRFTIHSEEYTHEKDIITFRLVVKDMKGYPVANSELTDVVFDISAEERSKTETTVDFLASFKEQAKKFSQSTTQKQTKPQTEKEASKTNKNKK